MSNDPSFAHGSRDESPDNTNEPAWKPLSPVLRRVVGVLVEKAKTTPENYPLSLNALTTGCNQKSNRSPQMNLQPDDVQIALDELRQLGAVVEVQSGGRVPKYKHCMYQWLGVDKVELAVIAELLLRGPQTVGELRGRAARMEPISDLNALRPVLDSLIQKQLVVELTPPGRGQLITHGLYEPVELQRLREKVSSGARVQPAPGPSVTSSAQSDTVAELRDELAQLRGVVEKLRGRVERLEQHTGIPPIE